MIIIKDSKRRLILNFEYCASNESKNLEVQHIGSDKILILKISLLIINFRRSTHRF